MPEIDRRLITLSPHGEQLAAEPAITKVMDSLNENGATVAPAAYYTMRDLNEEIKWLIDSDFLSTVSASDRDSVRSIVNKRDTQWATLGDQDNVIARFDRMASDILLLGGFTARDLIQDGNAEILAQHHKYGFEGILDFSSFLGGVILARERDFGITEQGNTFEINRTNHSYTQIAIGGDMNGDFVMTEQDIHETISLDPTGNPQYFSPKPQPIKIFDYHSTEPGFMVAAMKHLSRVYDVANQKDFICGVANLYSYEQPKEPTPNFADYGMRSEEFDIDMMKHYFENGHDKDQTDVLAKWPVANRRVISTKITSRDDALVIANVATESEEVGTEIAIPNHDVGAFMLCLLNQAGKAQGRTGDGQLMNILEARFKMLSPRVNLSKNR